MKPVQFWCVMDEFGLVYTDLYRTRSKARECAKIYEGAKVVKLVPAAVSRKKTPDKSKTYYFYYPQNKTYYRVTNNKTVEYYRWSTWHPAWADLDWMFENMEQVTAKDVV